MYYSGSGSYGYGGYGYGGYGSGCYGYQRCCGGGYGGYALVLVLFILLVIIGATRI